MAAKKKGTHKKQQEQQERKRKILLLIAACAVVFTVIGAIVSIVLERAKEKTPVATTAAEGETAERTGSYYADIAIKDYGTITVALDETAAPETVANFVSLAQAGFYDGLTFHRIINGFMMQGGDPNGDGTGGSDETIKGEFSDNGVDNPISHVRGTISMARSNNMNSASSQFFIVQADSLFLDGQYAGFGHVTEGIEIVDQICEDAVPTDNNGSISKDQQPVIESITIREVP